MCSKIIILILLWMKVHWHRTYLGKDSMSFFCSCKTWNHAALSLWFSKMWASFYLQSLPDLCLTVGWLARSWVMSFASSCCASCRKADALDHLSNLNPVISSKLSRISGMRVGAVLLKHWDEMRGLLKNRAGIFW